MTDKEKLLAIRTELERRIGEIKVSLDDIDDWRYRLQREHDMELMKNFSKFIDSMQEEPVHRTKADVDAAMREVEEKAKLFTVAMNGKSSEQILAEMRGEEPVSDDFEEALSKEWKDYNDRGAATVDALEDNTQELSFAKGFYRDAEWGKNQAKAEIQAQSMALAHGCPKEHISKELEVAAKNVGQKYFPNEDNIWARPNYEAVKAECAFKDGAKWQKANLWKPADGDDLPEIDREVIVLTRPYPNDEHQRIVFAHRPNKYTKVWNYDLGEEQIVEIERYGKGGWNIPNIVYWLDVERPKEIEL